MRYPAPPHGSKKDNGFSESLLSGKQDSAARAALFDLLSFRRTLDEELRELCEKAEPTADERELLDKMQLADAKYQAAFEALAQPDENPARHALMSLADALQDLMTCIHRQRRH